MKNRLNQRIRREYRQLRRCYQLYLLCKAYEQFHMMKLHAECVKQHLDYEEASDFSDTMNTLFGYHSCADDFLLDENEESNKALEHYQNFRNIVGGLGSETEKCFTAFCNDVYYRNHYTRLRIDGHIYYPMYIRSVIMYRKHHFNWQQVRDSIIEVNPLSMRPIRIDSVAFRKDFVRIEAIYDEIVEKRIKRHCKNND